MLNNQLMDFLLNLTLKNGDIKLFEIILILGRIQKMEFCFQLPLNFLLYYLLYRWWCFITTEKNLVCGGGELLENVCRSEPEQHSSIWAAVARVATSLEVPYLPVLYVSYWGQKPRNLLSDPSWIFSEIKNSPARMLLCTVQKFPSCFQRKISEPRWAPRHGSSVPCARIRIGNFWILTRRNSENHDSNPPPKKIPLQ